MKQPPSRRRVEKMRERERSVGLEPDDAAAQWLDENAPKVAVPGAEGGEEVEAAAPVEAGAAEEALENALSPVSARPISSFWIWLVPSYSVETRASRRYFCTGNSST